MVLKHAPVRGKGPDAKWVQAEPMRALWVHLRGKAAMTRASLDYPCAHHGVKVGWRHSWRSRLLVREAEGLVLQCRGKHRFCSGQGEKLRCQRLAEWPGTLFAQFCSALISACSPALHSGGDLGHPGLGGPHGHLPHYSHHALAEGKHS